MKYIQWLIIAMVTLTGFMLSGCGGGGGGDPVSTPVKFSIVWAARARSTNAPSSALSAVLILEGAKPGGGQFRYVVNRPDGSIEQLKDYITNLPALVGRHAMTISFYSDVDGKGDVVGVAMDMVNLAADGTGISGIATEGQVADVQVPEGQIVAESATKDLAVAVTSAKGTLIAVSPASVFWRTVTGDQILKFENGHAMGLLHGVATVTATVDARTSRPAPVTVAVEEMAVLVPLLAGASATGYNNLEGMSSDGTWVCGDSESGQGNQAYRWRLGQPAAEALGMLPGSTSSSANGISDDGQTVVGSCKKDDKFTAFVWHQGTGMTAIPAIPDTATSSEAAAVSGDGQTVVGSFTDEEGTFGFVWNTSNGFIILADMMSQSPAPRSCFGMSVNRDGTIALFKAAYKVESVDEVWEYSYQPMTWRANGSIAGLGFGYNDATDVFPYSVNRSGSMVLAVAQKSASNSYIAKWTPSGGWVSLISMSHVAAQCSSDDGERIAGGGPNAGDAFLYDAKLGYINLYEYMTRKGLLNDLDVSPTHIMACSADGVVLGGGCYGNGVFRSFVTRLNR